MRVWWVRNERPRPRPKVCGRMRGRRRRVAIFERVEKGGWRDG